MESTDAGVREAPAAFQRLWWIWLVVGIMWLVISLVILQFNTTSLNTVGIIIGIMVLLAGFQQFFIATVADRWKWVWVLFGALFVIGGIVALAYPKNAFAAVADMLGFIFLMVGLFWVVESFSIKETSELWWFNLIAGIMMIGIAFWTAGQYMDMRAFTLITFAGVWAMFHGITDITMAFQVKKLDKAA